MELAQRLSHYRIMRRLGAGGMGVVYEAQDLALGRLVAIKVLPPELAADHQTVLRFQREARAASALNHPHICTIHELGEHDGQPFIVMERLEGKTLRHLLRAGPLEASVLLDLAVQVAGALDAAHRAGIIHRDLKPDNIFVAEHQVVKLLDFGLAKLTDGGAVSSAAGEASSIPTLEEPLTEAGHTPGTLLYMSPEQARGEEVDCRTDLFSFGAVLYEMATGRRPFAGPSPSAIKEAVLCSTPEPPSASNAGLPPGFDALVARALEKDRALRYQTAADLAADLARLKRDAGDRRDAPAVAARAPDVRPALAVQRPEAPEPRIAGRRAVARWIWPAAAGVVLVAAGVGLWSGRWGDLPGRHRASPRIESIAVLPLENLSRDPDQQYFTDGMTEALITNLSGIRALRVISRTSSTRASQGAARRLSDIARILDVDAIVEGTVVRAGDRVRISARLIDTASDRSVWANAYERDFRDVLRLQADVARAVADEIGSRLGGERLQVAASRPVDPKAYELYLKGRYFLNLSAGTSGSDAEEGWKKAIDYFNRAIRVDDRCAPAWAGLADSYYQLSSVVLPPDQAIPDARAAAARALEIDDTLAEAHTSLGVIKSQYDWDRTGAERELTRAIALNPNYAAAHQYLGMYYYADGRFTEALAAFEKARQIDPLSFFIAVTAVWPLPYLGRYEEAIGQLEQVVEMHPEVPDIAGYLHELRGEVLLQRGRPDAAVAELLQGHSARDATGDSPAGVAALRAAFARGGIRGYWQKLLDLSQRKYRHDLASASRQPQPRYVSPFQVARLFARLGEKEAAFAVLDGCLRSRDENLLWLKAESLRPDSTWTSIRSDPRFAAILRRVGLEPPDFSSGALAASAAKAP